MMSPNARSIEVKQSGNTLVAGFHTANPPLIWNFDLERNHSFTLALQGEEGDWELGLTSLKGEFYPIARFLNHEDAEEAFAKTQDALMRNRKTGGTWNGWRVLGLVSTSLIVIFIVFSLFSSLSQKHMTSKRAAASGEMVEGVPMPADEILKPPEQGLRPSP